MCDSVQTETMQGMQPGMRGAFWHQVAIQQGEANAPTMEEEDNNAPLVALLLCLVLFCHGIITAGLAPSRGVGVQ